MSSVLQNLGNTTPSGQHDKDKERQPQSQDPSAASAAGAVGAPTTKSGSGQGSGGSAASTVGGGAVPSSGGGSKMFLYAIGITGCLAVVLGIVAVFGQQSRPTVERATIRTGANIGFSAEEEIRLFLKNYGLKIDRHDDDIKRLQQEVTTLQRQQEQALASMNNRIEGVTKTFQQAGESFLARIDALAKQIEERAGRESSRREQETLALEQERTRILRELRDAWAAPTAGLTREEARRRAVDLLKKAGFKDADIQAWVSKAAEEAGVLINSDVAEPPPSQEEINAVPEYLRPWIAESRSFLEGKAMFEGVIDHHSAKAALRRFLELKIGKERTLTSEDLDKFYTVVRVRRENIPDFMADEIPALIRQRDALGIDRRNLDEVARLINAYRSKMRGMPTPGQLLTLVEVVSRAIGAGEKKMGSVSEFPPISEEQRQVVRKIIEQALENAWVTGRRDEAALGPVALRVLENYLEVARVSMPTNDRADFTAQIIVDFMIRKRMPEAAQLMAGSPSAARTENNKSVPPSVAAASASAGSGAGSGPSGPRTTSAPEAPAPSGGMTREQWRQTLYLMTDDILRAANIPPRSIAEVCAAVVYWEQLPRLVHICSEIAAQIPATEESNATRQQSATARITREIFPQLVEVVRAGASLADISIGLPSQQDSPQKKKALYAWLAKYVGQYIHDHTKTADKIAEADGILRGPQAPNMEHLIKTFGSGE